MRWTGRFLGYSRAALGLLLVVRTTPLSRWLPWPVSHVAPPLLGWPEHGFRAAWGGVVLSDSVVIALCIVRTIAAVLFMLGLWTRAAGTVAAVAAFAVLSQDAFGFKFTFYALFVGTWLLAISGGGCTFALRAAPAGRAGPSPPLVHAFVASVYAWSAIAKLRMTWLTGETLRALHEGHYLTGALSDVLFATLDRCRAAACCVVAVELLLGPLLLVRPTRKMGIALAVGMHAAYEWTAHPDVFGWIMGALLISFADRELLAGRQDDEPRRRAPNRDLYQQRGNGSSTAGRERPPCTLPREAFNPDASGPAPCRSE